MDTVRTQPGPLAVNTNVSSTAFFNRIQNNRALLIRLGIAFALAVVVIGGLSFLFVHRSNVASAELADAMRTYDTPINTPDQPVPPGTKSFSSLEERARVSNGQFASIADHYGMTVAGRNAQYLQGVTALQMGQNATAETLLKKSADSWNRDVATLAEIALAGMYRGSGRDADAIAMYQKIAAKPSTVVPAGLARLQLAELYEGTNKPDQAKKIYAEIKDKDPKSAAADIATQKLSGAPAR